MMHYVRSWRGAGVLAIALVWLLAGCGGGGGDSDMGPVTWSLEGSPPVPAMINGGPWTLTQLAAGNPDASAVRNKSFGYAANFMTANTGSTSPMQPYYFPFVVGSGSDLQGYFDWRPKDINEAIVAARSSDGGQTWEFQQMALVLTQALPLSPQSTNPDAGVADNGFGHPTVIQITDPLPIPTPSPEPGQAPPTPFSANTFLYTLDRSADAAHKQGLIVTPLQPTAAAPLNGARLDIPAVNDFTDESRVLRTTGLLNPDGILAVVPGVLPTTVLYIQKINNGDASGSSTLPGSQQCGTQPYVPIGASAPNPANHDLVRVRIATTYDGVDFYDQGTVSGLHDPRATGFDETRSIAPNGTILDLGGGRYGLFFAGGNCMDASGDAIHYIGYAESTDPSWKMWTVLNDINNPIVSIASHTVPVDGVPTEIPAHPPVVGPALHEFESRVYCPMVVKLDDDTVSLIFAGYHVQDAQYGLLDYRSINVVKLHASRRL
jgi:hypothetical protein